MKDGCNMNTNLQAKSDFNEEPAVEGAALQEPAQQKAPFINLPFDLTAELGEIRDAQLLSPGVYFLSTKKVEKYSEVYVVAADASAISEKARSYGQEFPGHPDLRVYEVDRPGSGRRIIEFELRRYRMKCHLPEIETGDSIFSIALYGAEEHPDYFGGFPVPSLTPRGYTVRHKIIMNGVYWLETDRCEEMLAVCYPIWQADITIPEQNQGEQLEYDRVRGIDNALGYLFFPKQSSCIPLYELSRLHSEIEEGGMVNMAALSNAICEFYPEYTAMHNEEESKYGRNDFIKETAGAGTEFVSF